jgi:hypothetical protein
MCDLRVLDPSCIGFTVSQILGMIADIRTAAGRSRLAEMRVVRDLRYNG